MGAGRPTAVARDPSPSLNPGPSSLGTGPTDPLTQRVRIPTTG
ncbi:MAG: hypothetical protein PGN37_05445 [Mycobacterium kyogaense]